MSGALTGSDAAPMSKAARALTRRKKKQGVEEKPELDLDLSSALPASNDFRTSLIMPNLSARFSMLREQDDPNTKVGKASDDSVLFPKRASRLMLFNNSNALKDIAEVESVYSSFRPPFAEDRHGSISDGYASDDGGSMMNRSRPVEGNNLFGGRQKLYKIPTASSKNLPTEGALTGTKHLYEHDVSLSAFQQLRLREKEQREQQSDLDEKTDRSSLPTTEAEDQDSTRSPVNAFSRNRGTQSSTNSGPSNRRVSTAATSLVSDSPRSQQNNHAVTKLREQEANSSAENIGFATSPSLRKVREEGNNAPQQSNPPRNAANMRDNHSRESPIPPPQAFRSMSPPPNAASQPLDFGLRENTKSPPLSRFQATSPMSQFDFEQDDALAGSLLPNDRGKATALGLFNKPARHYDDAQFQQRQVQMHEDRKSPASTSSRAASRASPEPTRSARPSYASTSSPRPSEDNSTPQVPRIPDYPPSPASNGRSSANSGGRRQTSRPRTKSSASTKEAIVQARVQSLIKEQNAELAALEATQLESSQTEAESENIVSPAQTHNHGTFFDVGDDSDSEEQEREQQPPAPSMPSIRPPSPPSSDIHPALRDAMQDFDFGTETQQLPRIRTSNGSTQSKTRSSANKRERSEPVHVVDVEDLDSPTVPTTGLGLSGLIRTHLRHDSDRSCMFPESSPALLGADGLRGSVCSTTRTATESVKSDPFEYDSDRLSAQQLAPSPEAPLTPTTLMSMRAQQMLGTAMALRDAQTKADATPNVGTSDEVEHDHHETHSDTPGHQRNESTETQKEMQRFDEELASRRKKIEESLNTVQERSRSGSPVAERSGGYAGHGFSLPRFPGRHNTGDRAEPQVQSKAMKMLGIAPTSKDQMSPRPPPEHFDGARAWDMSTRQAYRPSTAQGQARPSVRHNPNSGRSGRPGTANGHERPPPPRSTTPSSRPGIRNRSNSIAVDRSVSRNKHVPDFDRPVMPGAFPNSPFPSASPQENFHSRPDSPANRTYERSASSAAGHYADRTGYFANKPLAPPEMDDGFTPRPSPRPSPNPNGGSYERPTGAPMSPPPPGMPSPNPAMQNGRTTPTFAKGRSTSSGPRKRSVTKDMISEPTFVSSTSTVPLVHLPRNGGPGVDPAMAPPVPVMNPRRRGDTADQANTNPGFNPHPAVRLAASPLPLMPESPDRDHNSSNQPQAPPPHYRPRNKLRKSSSEGGNMAAHARQQAQIVEIAREKVHSPTAAVFPNKSTTALSTHNGPMF